MRMVNKLSTSTCPLVPLPSDSSMEDELISYFQSVEDSDYDADSEASDVSDEVDEPYVLILIITA